MATVERLAVAEGVGGREMMALSTEDVFGSEETWYGIMMLSTHTRHNTFVQACRKHNTKSEL